MTSAKEIACESVKDQQTSEHSHSQQVHVHVHAVRAVYMEGTKPFK